MALRSFLDGNLLAEVYGSPPPRVLALHGWGRRGSDFARSLGGFSTIAPDLPGFGATPAPTQVIGAEGYAHLIARILDEFETPPVVVGHSFGGRIAVWLSVVEPARVGPLVLTGVPLVRLQPGRRPSLGFRAARFANRRGLLSDERMERLRRSHGSADYRAATGITREILVKVVNESYEEQIKRVGQPVRMLWGADDNEVPLEVAREASQHFLDSTLKVLPGIGHLVPTEAPDELRATVGALIR